jgi:hypothetical protein
VDIYLYQPLLMPIFRSDLSESLALAPKLAISLEILIGFRAHPSALFPVLLGAVSTMEAKFPASKPSSPLQVKQVRINRFATPVPR